MPSTVAIAQLREQYIAALEAPTSIRQMLYIAKLERKLDKAITNLKK